MAAANSAGKKKLSIATCSIDNAGKITVEKNKFEVMLNPSSYKHAYEIDYDDKTKAMGQVGSDTKFAGTKPEKINFDIMLDGTGVVNDGSAAPKITDVKSQIKALSAIVYKYDGLDHEPNHVRVLWGSLIFYGRLKSMTANYTLFKPNGEPLRAKVELGFTGFVSNEEESLKANRSSPDLTHVIEVKSGDTLPLLCNRVYNDPSYYLAVAEVNGIAHFRDIRPGQKLYFPPLGPANGA